MCRVEKTALVNVPFKECLLFGSGGDASVRNPDFSVAGESKTSPRQTA